jgi:serine/threonine protein phosphatase PrpC
LSAATSLSGLTIAVAALSDAGLHRQGNEDSYLAESPVYLVADGMGGYEAGDKASAAVVEAFRTNVVGPEFPTLDDVRDALVAADAGVAEVADGTDRGAGSTVSGLVLVEHEGLPHWLVFNVGDSRVYRHDGSYLEQLTVDHSLGQELIDRGKMARKDLATYADRNVITRAIGAADSTADSWLLPVTNGERILICSDGLSSEVEDEAIRAILTMSGRPEAAAAALVRTAKQNGGRDNITVVVLDVVSGGGSPTREYTSGVARLPTAVSDSAIDDTTIPV